MDKGGAMFLVFEHAIIIGTEWILADWEKRQSNKGERKTFDHVDA